MNMRKKIFETILPDDGSSRLSRWFDFAITALIIASVVIVFASTFDLSPCALRIVSVLEGVVSVAFTIEYALRIATADFLYPQSGKLASRIRYIFSPMALVDLVAILPFWLPMLLPGTMLGIRALRLVRLMRIFKLNRYSDAMKSLGGVIALKRRELLCSMFFVGLLMLISSLFMYSAEHDAQPTVFRNAFSGLWWAVATLTTVGYGDIYPVTAAGRIVGAFIAFSGLAAVAIPTGIISSGLMERMSKCDQTAKEAESGSEVAEVKAELLEQGETLKAILEKLS
jgi:voltage-gated potassium channel